MNDKSTASLPGTVEKIIKSPIPNEPEKAQIAVDGADHLYREIRIDNAFTNETALTPDRPILNEGNGLWVLKKSRRLAG